MKALVYHGPGQEVLGGRPRRRDPGADRRRSSGSTPPPSAAPTCTSCTATSPAVTDGRILGHEAVGTVTEVGDAVNGSRSATGSWSRPSRKCGRCEYCQRGMPSHCQTVGGIGWIFGHLIDGTQAEFVRVPYADTSLYTVPEGVTDEQAIFLADSLPTGYEVGVLAGGSSPGDTVAVVGAGAVGLSAILTTGCGARQVDRRRLATSSGWRRPRDSARPTPSRSDRTRSPTSWRSPTVSASTSRSRRSATPRPC